MKNENSIITAFHKNMKKARWKAILIDRDGVLVTAKGGARIAGAGEWLDQLLQYRIPFLIATNHSTSGPEDAAEDLINKGFKIRPDTIHTPLTVLLDVLMENPPGSVYVSGTDALREYVREAGFALAEVDKADMLLMGFDQAMTYRILSDIIEAMVRRNMRWIALHENRLYKTADGRYEPGLGAWVRAIEYATGRKALIMGKPSPVYYRKALEKLGVSPEETLMISDDPFGDLEGARRLGIKTAFVLSGIYEKKEILNRLPEPPDIVCAALSDIDIFK